MPFVTATKEEVERVKTAIRERNWQQLGTWKERFMYQMYCNDNKGVQEIAEFARMKNRKQYDDTYQAALDVFGSDNNDNSLK